MNETSGVSATSTWHPRRSGRAMVVLVYQDARHERLGKTYWEGLSHYLGWNGAARLTEWKFEMLACAKLREMAATEAQEAPLVVLAADSAGGLADAVKTWFERWATGGNTSRSVLVVLLTEVLGCPAAGWPDHAYVQSIASQCGRKLVVYASGFAAESSNPFCLADARRLVPPGLVAVEHLPELQELAAVR
jgi:hypothetical protein